MPNRKFYAILAALTTSAVLMLILLLAALLSQPVGATPLRSSVREKVEEQVTSATTSRQSDWPITLSVAGLLGLVAVTTYLATWRPRPAGRRAGLRLVTGQASPTWTELRGGELRIGWGRDNELRVFDPKVAYCHAVVRAARGQIYLQDQGSVRGTFVNGQRIEATALSDGDRIRVGETEFSFHVMD